MKRKGSIAAAPPPACPPSAIALPPGAAKSKTYVEFHASMSLDNPTSALSFMTPSSSPSSSAAVAPLSSHHQQLNALLPVTYENTTLEQILKQRFQVWSQAHEQRETHLRTLQLALLHERNLCTSKKGLEQPPPGPEPAAQLAADAVPVSTRVEPSAATIVGQLVESLEDFDGVDAFDLFQLAM